MLQQVPAKLQQEIRTLHEEVQQLEESKCSAESQLSITMSKMEELKCSAAAEKETLEKDLRSVQQQHDDLQSSATQLGQELLQNRSLVQTTQVVLILDKLCRVCAVTAAMSFSSLHCILLILVMGAGVVRCD